MHITLLRAVPVAAFALLAGCNTQPTTITGGGPNDPTADAIKAAPPVKLPPALLASKTYRCKDNSVVYVDFFNDNMMANLKAKKDDMPTVLNAPAGGQPYVGGGYELTGTADAKSVMIKKPGGAAQSCNA